MSLKNKVIKNLFSNWAGMLITIIVSFFMAPYVVHKLGNTFYGIWTIINQFTAYLYLFDFGIRESVIRYTAKYMANNNKKKLEDVIQASFYIYLLVAILSLIITIVLAYVFAGVFNIDSEYSRDASLAVLLIGGTISQIFIFNVFNGFLMGNQRYDIFNIVQIIATLTRTFFFIIVLEMGYGIAELALVQFIVFLVSGMVMTRICMSIARGNDVKINLAIPSWRDMKDTFSKVFNYSFYVFINNIGQKIIFMTDAIVIGIFMPVASVTYYAIAGTLIEYLRKLVVTSSEILNPLVSHYSATNDDEKVKYTLISGTKLTLFVALPIASTFIFLGDTFIGLWMGNEFAETSGKVLMILAIAQAFSAPHFSVSSVLYGMNKHKTLAQFRIVEAVINLILSILLIQDYGVVGVALGTAIPHIILVAFILPAYACKVTNMSLSKYLIDGYVRPLVAIIPFITLCYFIKIEFLPDSLLMFFIFILQASILYLFVSYYVVFTKVERKSINSSVFLLYNKRFTR